MPLYLVRWPDLSFSLVSARNEDDLRIVLDEVSDPGGCRWKVYRGPLFLDFSLRAAVERDEPHPGRPITQIRVKDASEIVQQPVFSLNDVAADSACEMWEEILAFAFPHLAKYYAGVYESEKSDAGELKEALLKELEALGQHSWKWAAVQRRTDPEGLLMQTLGVTENPYTPRPRPDDPTPRPPSRRKPKATPKAAPKVKRGK